MEKDRFEPKWSKLDNAALVYPSASSAKWNNVFRVSAYLKQNVDPQKLQQALNIVIERFPNFDVTLRRGFFWYYFQSVTEFPKVAEEKTYPCQKMELNKKKHLFRVLYFKNKISFETFHSLTDGSGAVCFLNALLACYFDLCGQKISSKQLAVDYSDKPSPEEMEDSFKRFADFSGKAKRQTKRCFQIAGTPEQNGVLNVITLVASASKLNQVAKEHNATITQFLVAIYAKAIINNQLTSYAKKRPVTISVPTNLRKIFPSQTLRNFSSWVNVSFCQNQKTEDIDKLIAICKEQMSQVTKENMLKNINANIASEKNFFVRTMPLAIKNLALHLSYKIFGERTYTTVLTNLGRISAPEQFCNLVDRYECLLCKSMINTLNIGIATFGDKISISFTSCIKEHTIERNFCRILKKFGVDIVVYSNIK